MARTTSRSKPLYHWTELPWWVRTLTIIGVLAVTGMIVALFFRIGNGPPDLTVTLAPPVDSREFLLAWRARRARRCSRAGPSSLLNNGDEFFPALCQAIRARAEAA